MDWMWTVRRKKIQRRHHCSWSEQLERWSCHPWLEQTCYVWMDGSGIQHWIVWDECWLPSGHDDLQFGYVKDSSRDQVFCCGQACVLCLSWYLVHSKYSNILTIKCKLLLKANFIANLLKSFSCSVLWRDPTLTPFIALMQWFVYFIAQTLHSITLNVLLCASHCCELWGYKILTLMAS